MKAEKLKKRMGHVRIFSGHHEHYIFEVADKKGVTMITGIEQLFPSGEKRKVDDPVTVSKVRKEWRRKESMGW